MTAADLSLNNAAADDRTYRHRINAWALYDVANSAFFTTILAAVLPTYYSQVAGATLPSAALATQRWTLSLSAALLISALLSPVLGTLSDVTRSKKRLLGVFLMIGAVATGLLVLVGTGDWLLASVLIIIGRAAAGGANVFYDALLPHVARQEDQDAVSTRGFALGYLGGGVLLAVNILMFNLPDDLFGFPFEFAGIRLAFLSVAVWWVLFSLPLFRLIPEPPAATERAPDENVIAASINRLRGTFADLREYRELFKYLIAFLIYNDGIGTIIGVAAIYGAELGFDTTELVLALLLVQFVGIPFSFIFGNLPNSQAKNRHYYLAFILFNVLALPLVAITARANLPYEVTGAPPPPYQTIGESLGEGTYPADTFAPDGWTLQTIPADLLNAEEDVPYTSSDAVDATYTIPFNGQSVRVTYATGADFGTFAVQLDGKPLLNDDNEPIIVDAYSANPRFGVTRTFAAPAAGEHTLTLVNTGEVNAQSAGTRLSVGPITVLPPARGGNLLVVIGVLLAIQAVAVVFTFAGGARLLYGFSRTLNTKRAILLALVIYGGIALWGYWVNSTVEFWFLAWMVGIVQGGSQALSRSLYASMSPAAKSGEFFGLFSVMAKFSAITGPLLFALAIEIFGQSRPAVLSLIALFVIGGYLLTRVDVDGGRALAQAENARYAASS